MSTYQVAALPHPFAVKRLEFTQPAGATIDDVMVEIVRRSGCQPAVLWDAAVLVGDVPIPMAYWSQVHVKAGSTVVVRAVPGRNVLSVLIVVATLVAAVYLPPLAGLGGFAAKLASAAIGSAGSLAEPLAERP